MAVAGLADRGGKHDTGIDIVAVDRPTGGNVAIQCKFFDPNSTISKPDIDTFLSASGKEGFTQRIIVSTTDKWNAHAEDAIQGQQVPVRRIGLADLEASTIDWDAFDWATPKRSRSPTRRSFGRTRRRPSRTYAAASPPRTAAS